MPPKIRDLKRDLRRAGFDNQSDRAKGSHSLWVDPNDPENRVLLSSNDGADAKHYQIKDTQLAISRRKTKRPSD